MNTESCIKLMINRADFESLIPKFTIISLALEGMSHVAGSTMIEPCEVEVVTDLFYELKAEFKAFLKTQS